jgi:hypothetical protein
MTENPYDNFDWNSLLTLMAYGSVRVELEGRTKFSIKFSIGPPWKQKIGIW